VSMNPKVLITGGAGFLGTHLARELLRRGCELTLLDNFNPQIHGAGAALPADLAAEVRLHRGDVRDASAWHAAMPGHTCIVHLAAETGTAQSMYAADHYTQVNVGGTQLLCDALSAPPVERIVLASSRAVYGEGAYRCAKHGTVYPPPQSDAARIDGRFDPVCPECSSECAPAPTTEDAPLQPLSIYGVTKQQQEHLVLSVARQRGIPAVALRYQNIYGPGQSLHNPYTGILATLSNLAHAGEPIEIFEDGRESRDFISVDDAARATADCVTGLLTGQCAVNIGSGIRTPLLDLAHRINSFYGSRSDVRVSGRFRHGDIRHALADLTLARTALHFEPLTSLADGLNLFLAWASQSPPDASHSAALARSLDELRRHGLLHG